MWCSYSVYDKEACVLCIRGSKNYTEPSSHQWAFTVSSIRSIKNVVHLGSSNIFPLPAFLTYSLELWLHWTLKALVMSSNPCRSNGGDPGMHWEGNGTTWFGLLGAVMTISRCNAQWPRACGFGGKQWVSSMLPLTCFRASPRLHFLILKVGLSWGHHSIVTKLTCNTIHKTAE